MRRLRGPIVLTTVGAVGALLLLSGAGIAWKSRIGKSGGNAVTQPKTAHRLNVGDDEPKSRENPAGRRIPIDQLMARSELSPALEAAVFDAGESARRSSASGRGAVRNAFVNDPCLDPPPTAPFPLNFLRTVQSETDIAVLNAVRRFDDDDEHERRGGGQDGDDDEHDRATGRSDSRGERGDADRSDDDEGDDEHENDHYDGEESSGRLMVAAYNDSSGFYDNRQGISGFSYSTDGGREWIDAGGLPPLVPSGAPAGTPGSDAYYGDPVVVVHHRSKTFYYASIYQSAAGYFTISVNRGRFKVAPQQVPVESRANTRCEGNPGLFGVPDQPEAIRERIIWDPPVEAVPPPFLGGRNDAFLDKEWLYVDQKTGFLYVTYTRGDADGSTPLELVRSFDRGHTWTPPTIIVPNLNDTFNTATQAIVTPTGRVIVSWVAETFELPSFADRDQRIEVAVSDDGGTTFGPPIIVAHVNPQGPPPGYNRNGIVNVPYLAVDKGRDDGVTTSAERHRSGFGNVYLTYFHGKTPLAPAPNPPTRVFARAADIYLSTSCTNGNTWNVPVKVNDDMTSTSHVFSSVQVNDLGEIFVTWIDRRVDPMRNLLNDTYGDISDDQGRRLGRDFRITDVSTDWISREDAAPDYGDYNSSEVVGFRTFLSIWADGRFPPPAPLTPAPGGGYTRPVNQSATPDSLMAVIGRRDRE